VTWTGTFVWTGLDSARIEIARALWSSGRLEAQGTQIGTAPEPYELRYRLEPGWLAVEVVGGHSLELGLEGTDFFDLGFSPLFNSLPVRRDGLHRGGEARDYTMTWIDVPSLAVERTAQRYEPLRAGCVRYSDASFSAEVDFDEDGFVVRYPGLAERVHPPLRETPR